MNSTVFIVITWNNAADSIECIRSLLAQDTADFTILSIDNHSTDNSAEQLQAFITAENSPMIKFIETGHNGGTAGGFNAGIRWAIENDYKYIGSLNADATADKKWARSLVEELDTHLDSGIAAGLLLRTGGATIDTSGNTYTTWGLPSSRNRNQGAEAAPKKAGYIFGFSGGAFLARTDIFKHIGFFDETFFMYYEDMDISFRAQLAEYRVRYTPKAIAYHKLSASSNTVPGLATYNTFKNLPILLIKNVPLGLLPKIYPRFFLLHLLIAGNAIIKGRGVSTLKGFLKGITLIPHAFRERRRIQKHRKVTVAYIDSIILHDIPPEQTGMRKFRKFFTGKA